MNKTEILAFVCRICPVCIFARRYPESKVANVVEKEKQHCPFCRAYDELKKAEV